MRERSNNFINESENKKKERIMKHKLSTTLALVVLTMALAASTAGAQTVAPGPYYANPSWDQKLACDSASNCPRFVVLSNWNSEAVLDRETGLVWQRSVPGTLTTFDGARQSCDTANTGSRAGWRLPSVQEIRTLVDTSIFSPIPKTFILALPTGHPFILGFGTSTPFWTGTTSAESPNSAYVTGFLASEVAVLFPKTDSAGAVHPSFWCVRGGGPISVY
jgi:hypothetical protein